LQLSTDGEKFMNRAKVWFADGMGQREKTSGRSGSLTINQSPVSQLQWQIDPCPLSRMPASKASELAAIKAGVEGSGTASI
jgi:hypothetical protein